MGLEDELFNLKFTSKQLMRSAKKCEKEEKTERGKVKKAIEKGNHEGAKIYATNAIRKKNESLNYMRLSSKVDAVSARLEQAIRTGQITKSMGSVAKTMGKTLGSMNLEKISMTMEKFEKEFENLDVQASFVESAMGTTTAMATPQEEVDGLIQQVADEHGLEVSDELGTQGTLKNPSSAVKSKASEDDELMARLNALKN